MKKVLDLFFVGLSGFLVGLDQAGHGEGFRKSDHVMVIDEVDFSNEVGVQLGNVGFGRNAVEFRRELDQP